MKHAIAIWNYCWDAGATPAWIDEFADAGFDAISFHPNQFAGSHSRHLPAIVDLLRRRGLIATVHGAVGMDRQVIKVLVEAMGDRLHAFTMDSAMFEDSLGKHHDARRIADALSYLQQVTTGSDVWLAVEDFPLDDAALKHFAPDLCRVYDHPRTGILIDVGHMHIRMQTAEYFKRMSVSDYFACLPCRLVEVHLHDNDGAKDQHGHIGLGTVPFPDIAGTLTRMKFDGVCTVEIAPTFHGSTAQESKGKAVQTLELWRGLMGRTV